MTGYLKPNVDTYHILYDFSEVDYKYKENISFENIVSGTFNICGQVLDASKIIGFDYTYSDAESTLTIKLDTSKWNFRLKKEVLFSYQLNVDDDSSSTCPSSATPSTYCTDITTSDYSAINTSSTTAETLTNGDKLSYTDTFAINNDSTITTIYGIYMDFKKTSSDSDSYFTLSSLYVNICTGTNIGCNLYDVSYSNSSGVSGIMIPSDSSDGYVPTRVTISTLNISLLFYVNSSSEYYFVAKSDYTAINTSIPTTATLANGDQLSYTDTFRINNDLTIYGIYMDFKKISSDSDSYFTLSSLYVNSCTKGTITCPKSYDVSYSNSSGDTVSGIMIPSESSDGYVQTTVTISTLNISLLFYVNSISEYYFVATTININDYEEINVDSSKFENLTDYLYYNPSCNLEAKPNGCSIILNALKFKGVLYSIFMKIDKIVPSTGSSYYKILSLSGIISCNSGIGCDGDVSFVDGKVGNEGLEITYTNSSDVSGIVIPSDSSSSEDTVVSIKYTYNFSGINFTYDNINYTVSLNGVVTASFATFTVNSDGEYYATISDSSDSICNQTFEINYTTPSCSSSSS